MKILINSALTTFFIGALVSSPAYAQVGGETNAEFSAVPPESERSDPPEVMLSLSRDHQYFFKAYNDYTDLDPDTGDVDADGNPNIETTYKHSFDYFGYFDSYKCYGRSSNRFIPQSINTDKYCSGSQWSGNFLNWATMTRMDVVRKIFYGGKRVVDENDETILRRAFLPHDAHSFAKYYNGDDIALLTPFNTVRVNGRPGDPDTDLDNIDEGITLCNTTHEGNGSSQDSTSEPLLRVAFGNYQLWGANERWQCTWQGEKANATNSNRGPSDPVTGGEAGDNFPDRPQFDGLNSGIDAHRSDPERADGREYEMDVEVCVDDLIGQERCKIYPNGTAKPIGLLQIYGDAGLINFGLMTGSYENNIEGGVLRKNTGPLNDEVDVAGSGRFIFDDSSDSIIKFLDRIRPFGYSYGDGTYRAGSGNRPGAGDDCTFQLTDIPNGRCNSWGNPISEIYKETIRYLAGLEKTNAFDADDTTFIDGLTDAEWTDPLDEDNQCADLNTILINASVSSYDSNNTDISDVTGGINGSNVAATGATTNTWTNMVGDQENITGQSFFVGRAGGATNEFCDSKVVDQLATVGGLCPEAPTVEGSFDMAGIAYYAHNNDIRPEGADNELDGNQTVNTFAISLATNVPIIRVPRSTPGLTPVEILPAYRLIKNNGQGGGALVDFKIVKPHTRIGTSNRFEASYYVNWEDSEQGGDYDQDVWGTIDYILNEGTNQLTITTTVFGQSTVNPQLFGFVTNGTTTDGFHAYSGIIGADYTDPTGVPGCNNCRSLYQRANTINTGGQQGPQSHTFTIAPSSAGVLESPLYYAAKYGGFSENLADGETVELDDQPDEQNEWDANNNITGAEGPDGLPDNFFFVINPENLFNSLETSLNKILLEERAASSAVASFASSNGFENIVIQGTYQELTRDDGAEGQIREVEWTGEIFASFIDEFGNFREDRGELGVLENFAVDRPFRFDLTGPVPRIQYLLAPTPARQIDESDVNGPPVEVSELNTVWNGGESLRNINNQDTVLQRPYSTVVPENPDARGASRYIFTHFDLNRNGRVDSGEQRDLLASNIDANNFGFFGVGDETVAENIVNFTRGFDDPDNTGFRNRTLKIDGEDRVYRLGDLINSTPLVVSSPDQGYDVRFNDAGYAEFFEKYQDRRQVAYVGANDGLIHAFNVGFRTRTDAGVGYSTTKPGGGSATAHPLGAELWAYAPFNLLPHLQWLTSGFYNHVYYVDGDPQSFDVNIFPASATHPGGWGTILVVGMRQGGGDFLVEANGTRTTSSSAYVVLDVTDPEREPVVLAEITHPDLNLTTSKPDLAFDCLSNCGASNAFIDGEWKLVFGSGPNDVKNLTTTEDAKIFTYDLRTRNIDVQTVTATGGAPLSNTYVGDVAVKDWDNGDLGFRRDDVAYFGTIGREPSIRPGSAAGNLDQETGGLFRLEFPRSGPNVTSLLFDTDRPVVQRPVALSRESRGNNVLGSWVFFGTGQYLKREDGDISDQERFYGLLEPIDSDALDGLSSAPPNTDSEDSDLLEYNPVNQNNLVDVTDVQVRLSGELVSGVTTPSPNSPARTFDELAEQIVSSSEGWFRDLPLGIGAGGPSLRVVDRTAVLRDQLFFVGFTPASNEREDICIGGEGESDIFVVNQTTGTASPFATLGVIAEGSDIIETSVSLGSGIVSAPIIFTSESLGSNEGKIILQRPDGSLIKDRTRCDGTVTFDPDEDINDCGDGSGGGGAAKIDDLKITRSSWRELYQQAADR